MRHRSFPTEGLFERAHYQAKEVRGWTMQWDASKGETIADAILSAQVYEVGMLVGETAYLDGYSKALEDVKAYTLEQMDKGFWKNPYLSDWDRIRRDLGQA